MKFDFPNTDSIIPLREMAVYEALWHKFMMMNYFKTIKSKTNENYSSKYFKNYT